VKSYQKKTRTKKLLSGRKPGPSCAIEVQREMAERDADVPSDRRIEFRMGINVGDTMKDGLAGINATVVEYHGKSWIFYDERPDYSAVQA
jgi:hypothetical protein